MAKGLTVYQWRVELLKKYDRIYGYLVELSKINPWVVIPAKSKVVFRGVNNNYIVEEDDTQKEAAILMIEILRPTYENIYNQFEDILKESEDKEAATLDQIVMFLSAWSHFKNNVENGGRQTKLMINDFLRVADNVLEILMTKMDKEEKKDE